MKSPVVAFALLPFLLVSQNGVAQAPPTETAPTVRATTNEVLLDVVVRDKKGKNVKNLKAEDLEVYEDGVRQEVISFRQVGTKEMRTQKTGSQTVKGAAPSAPAPTRALPSVNLICIVFYNLDPASRPRALEAIQEFLKSEMTPDTYVGTFLLDDRLKPVFAFSNNHAEIQQAVANSFSGHFIDFNRASIAVLTANPLAYRITAVVSGQSAVVTDEVTGGEVAKTTVTGADVSTGAGANAMRGEMVRERTDFSNLSGMRATDSIQTLIDQFGTLPGRKAVLLASTGLILTGDPDIFESLIDKARKAGITFYALDTSGLSQDSSAQAGNVALGRMASLSSSQTKVSGTAGEAREKSRQGDALEDAVRNSDSQASLRALSEDTGGFLIANTQDYKKPFQKIVDEVDTHYEVSYRPKSTTYDGRLRKIDVKLARADLTAEARKGYFAMPALANATPASTSEAVALAVLSADPPQRAFPFRTAAYRFRSDGSTTQNDLVFEVPGSSLTATPNASQPAHQIHFYLLSLVKDASGQVVDKYLLDAPFQIANANLPAVKASSVTYTHPVNLAPGKYTVDTAIVDKQGGRASSSTMQLEVPPPAKGLGISNLVLVQRVEPVTGQQNDGDPLVYQGKQAIPLLDPVLTKDAKPYVYFLVYPDKNNSEKPKIQVELFVGGQLAGKQVAELPAPDASGTIPMMVSAVLRPGDCELRMTAIQGSESVSGSVKYTVPAK